MGTVTFGETYGLIKRNENDAKKMWKTINKVLNKNTNSSLPPSLETNGKRLTTESAVLGAFNHHFTCVGPKLAKNIEVRDGDNCLQNINHRLSTLVFRTVDENYLLRSISQLKNGKSSGPDRIPVTVLKDVQDLIAKPLFLILNESITCGVFPNVWKLARVTPIFKSGSKNNVNNYRPISVISVFSKMLERLVHDQLFDFLDKNNIITGNQSAFRKLYSTVTSQISSTDYWYDNIDNKK